MQARDALVLVAEDDALQREVLVELLSLEGYRALPAATPEEVLAALLTPPDVVLLDLGGMVTPAVRAALARLRPRPAVVVISGDCHGTEAATRLAADAFLLKPCDVAQLLGTLGAVLSRGGAAGGARPRRALRP